MEFVAKFEYHEKNGKMSDKMEEMDEAIMACKKALQNHTQHITKIKKLIEALATKNELRKLADNTKVFALNTDLVDLYNKVVPPTEIMQAVGERMQIDVKTLQEIVA